MTRWRPLGAPEVRATRDALLRAVAVLLLMPVLAAASEIRIASLNLCTDILLLEAAPSDAALLLTHLAADPGLSPYAARAARQTRHRGLAEEILSFQPDWVIAEAGQAEPVRAILIRAGLEVLVVPPASDLASYAHNLSRVHERLGSSPSSDAETPSESGTPSVSAADTALLLAGHAYAPGPETLADDLLAGAGLQDARPDLRLDAGGEVSLEWLILNPPQFVVRSTAAQGAGSLAEAVLTHRALRQRLGEEALIAVPESTWLCGSQRTREGIALITHARMRAYDPHSP